MFKEIASDVFDWRAAFPHVFDAGLPATTAAQAGGFDCVVGNPPYIRQEWLDPFKPAFKREFRCYAGTADSYLYFIERGLDVLCPGGCLGFITSGTFNNAKFAAPFRGWLPTTARFLHSVNFGENQPFADAEMVFPSISILEKNSATTPDAPAFRAYFMRGTIPDSITDAVISDGIDCDASVLTRSEWQTSLADWQRQHADLTARLIVIETDIDYRVYKLFGLTAADRHLLADHSRHAMIDYPYGAV